MRVLIVGADGRGSFEVRGHQLGGQVGARVTTSPSARDWSWADVIVLVKRAVDVFAQQAAAARVPIVWDVLDYWRQPDANDTPVAVLQHHVLQIKDAIGIATLIGATQAMAVGLGGVYVPHHSRPGLAPEPPRTGNVTVGYEGQAKYLGPWRQELEHACDALGFDFMVNPVDLRTLDVVVAFRGGRWDGEVCRRWKSGVKYVNAVVAGRPVLTSRCSAALEIRPEGLLIDTPEELIHALDVVASAGVRQLAYETAVQRRAEFSIETVARTYRGILTHALEAAA